MASKIATTTFLLFGVLNINDPDWYIWTTMYFIAACLIFSKTKSKTTLFSFYFSLFALLCLNVLGFLNPHDTFSDTMVGLAENSREVVGILISMSVVWWFSNR